MSNSASYTVTPIGFVRSGLNRLEDAPRQGDEGAPNAWVEITPTLGEALEGIAVGQKIVLITWFHEARRDTLKVHPRDDLTAPLTGVFATRSPDRPNPLGLHRVEVLQRRGLRLEVGPLEAIDGTPVIDIKCVLTRSEDS